MFFERLKELGEALKNTEEEKEEETSAEKLLKFQEAEEEYKPTEEQIKLGQTDDTGETVSAQETIIREAKEKDKKDDLDDKIARIQKVIKNFEDDSQPTVIKTKMDTSPINDINLKAMDMGSLKQKEYLQSLIAQPSSQRDRVKLLYDELKRFNLI
tara:strand:- start:922 stop:1389 length:468 start_codon:yes stop_codon:yes gene_type:complete